MWHIPCSKWQQDPRARARNQGGITMGFKLMYRTRTGRLRHIAALNTVLLGLTAGCGSTESTANLENAADNTRQSGSGGTSINSDGNVYDAGAGNNPEDGDFTGNSPESLGGLTESDADASQGEASPQSEPAAPPSDIQYNPFVVAAHDPFSTFAADVDTASYDAFLRAIAEGRTFTAERVRLEEFINFFRYDYPQPAADAVHPFTINLEAGPNPLGRDTTLVRVGIQAVDLLATDHSAEPANIVFLVDVSGSMRSADKLPLVKRVMQQTMNELQASDRVAIVTYASGTQIALESTPVSSDAAIADAINGLSASGSTNGAGGIGLAYEQAEAHMVDGINHVVLLTDGDFNVGPSSDAELVALIEDKRASGITLTALGFGAISNDSMMEAVTNAGNGIYGLITSLEQADAYVAERLLSTLVHAAKDMKLQLEWNPELVHAYRLLGYENRDIADEDFRDDTVDAGEVGSGHQVTALYEVVLAGDEIPNTTDQPEPLDGEPVEGEREVGADELVRVKVRYKVPHGDEDAVETANALLPEDIQSSLDECTPDTRWAVGIATVAELYRESPYVDAAEWAQIESLLRDSAGDDADRNALLNLLDEIGERL